MELAEAVAAGQHSAGRRDAHQPRRLSARATPSSIRPSRGSSPCSTGSSSTLGHPLADLGYNCMMYHFGEGFGASGGYAGVDLEAFGIPTEAEYRRGLCAPHRPHGASRHWDFYRRLLAVPPRRHRAGRLQARPRRQRLVGDRHRATATAPRRMADLAWSLVEARLNARLTRAAYSSVIGTIEASLPLGAVRAVDDGIGRIAIAVLRCRKAPRRSAAAAAAVRSVQDDQPLHDAAQRLVEGLDDLGHLVGARAHAALERGRRR